MCIALYTLTSGLHSEVMPDASKEKFIMDIEAELGFRFTFRGGDFTHYREDGRKLIYVRTGGTEGEFLRLWGAGLIDAARPVRLLTSGKSNSLAASMEILAWLNAHGVSGEILHGPAGRIASRLQEEIPDFGGARLGIVGKPSDWLIASDVDPAKAREKLGLELVEIDIRELIEPLAGKDEKWLRSFAGSEAIYEQLKKIVEKYRLQGVTVRCFDLLDTVFNTGCLALARLNSEGIAASCEGDVPTLITMMLARRLTGRSGFQVNLSNIDMEKGEFLFAHCTVPLDMVSSFRYDTHFESGIGTAIKGELPTGPAKIMKISPDLEHLYIKECEILRNEGAPGLCRTQIVVRPSEPEAAAEYFLTRPYANHHVIVF